MLETMPEKKTKNSALQISQAVLLEVQCTIPILRRSWLSDNCLLIAIVAR